MCQATATGTGTFGFWLTPANYWYKVTFGGGTYGPFPLTAAVPSTTSGVSSFNTRTAAVTLLLSDVTALGTLTNNTSGLAATATTAANATGINGAAVPANQTCLGTNSLSRLVTGSCGGPTPNLLTLNNSGSGGSSPLTFDGSVARTVSWNTIGAQQALTLTTIGNNGAATLSGPTLNIPQYSGGGGSLNVLQTTSGSSTTLSVGASCSPTTPCNVRVGGSVYAFTAPGNVSLSGATGSTNTFAYVTTAGVLTSG